MKVRLKPMLKQKKLQVISTRQSNPRDKNLVDISFMSSLKRQEKMLLKYIFVL